MYVSIRDKQSYMQRNIVRLLATLVLLLSLEQDALDDCPVRKDILPGRLDCAHPLLSDRLNNPLYQVLRLDRRARRHGNVVCCERGRRARG